MKLLVMSARASVIQAWQARFSTAVSCFLHISAIHPHCCNEHVRHGTDVYGFVYFFKTTL